MGLKDQIGQEAEPTGPKRDQWGRPLLVPAAPYLVAQVNKSGKTWYSRASSLSDFASGVKTGIETWKRRHAVVGIARREDLAAMVAALPDMETDDKKNDQVTKAQLDEYIELASEHAGMYLKANYGTAIHGFTADGSIEHAPERMKADIMAYRHELERLGITPVLDEVFVACDPLRAAGTFDHLYRLPDGRVVVGDKKTGDTSFLDSGIQMAVYANSDVYDWRTDERTPLADVAGSFGTWDPTVTLHVDIPRGQARCEMTLLDSEIAYDLAHHATVLRDASYAAFRDKLVVSSNEGLFLERLHACKTRDELVALMKGVESDDAKEAANKQWKALA